MTHSLATHRRRAVAALLAVLVAVGGVPRAEAQEAGAAPPPGGAEVLGDAPLEVVGPAPGSTIGGSAAAVQVRVDDPGAPNAAVVLRLRDSTGEVELPMSFDPVTGLHGALLDTMPRAEGSSLHLEVYVELPAPSRDRARARWVVQVRNRPQVVWELPTTSPGSLRGGIPVEVTATDSTTPPPDLVVTVGPEGGPSVRLVHDGPRNRYLGTWPSTSVADGPLALAVTATDADGLTVTRVRQVQVANDPIATIHHAFPRSAVGVLRFEVLAARPDGSRHGLQVSWRRSGGTFERVAPVFEPDGDPVYRVSADTRAWPVGDHDVEVEVLDTMTGRRGRDVERTAVARPSWLSAELRTPLDGIVASGTVPVQAAITRGTHLGASSRPLVGWYRIDHGAWRAMALTADGRASAAWDTSAVAPGPHLVTVVVTDWVQVASSQATVTVARPGQLRLGITSPRPGVQAGTIAVEAVASGAVLGARAPMLARYRVDTGEWRPMAGDASSLRAELDTTSTWPGVHTVEVVATDLTSTVSDKVTFTVPWRLQAALVQAMWLGEPVEPGDPHLVLISAAVSSTNRPRSVLEATVRLGTGVAHPLVANPEQEDGLWFGLVPVEDEAPGTRIPVTLVVTDDRGDARTARGAYVVGQTLLFPPGS